MAKCPICRSDAEVVELSFVDGRTFRCAKHAEFQVSNSVLNVPTLMDADTRQWETALKRAAWRADPGLRPRISHMTSSYPWNRLDLHISRGVVSARTKYDAFSTCLA